MSKYIQCYYQYPVTFSSINKTFPSKDADGPMKNLIEVTDKELETLENSEPLYRALIRNKKYRVLNKVPESYKPAAMLVNEARARAEAAEAELAALKAERGIKVKDPEPEATGEKKLSEMSYKELQDKAAELGLEYKNQKKTELIAAIEAATK